MLTVIPSLPPSLSNFQLPPTMTGSDSLVLSRSILPSSSDSSDMETVFRDTRDTVARNRNLFLMASRSTPASSMSMTWCWCWWLESIETVDSLDMADRLLISPSSLATS